MRCSFVISKAQFLCSNICVLCYTSENSGHFIDSFKYNHSHNKNMKVQPHHFHISFLLIIKIILVIALVLLIKPALLGYKIDKQFEEMDMKPSEFLKTLD